MSDKNILISGVPANISGILVRQPTLHDIYKVEGHDVYSTYIYILGMTVKNFLEVTGLQGVFDELPEESKAEINTLDLLVAEPSWRGLLVKALSFFVIGEIIFDEVEHCLFVSNNAGDAIRINNERFTDIRDFVYKAACLKNEAEKPKGFYNEAAKKAYERLMELKAQKQQSSNSRPEHDPNMETWNLIGAVSARSHGYTLLNIWELTMYQLHDQFGRINQQEYLDGYATKWAAWGTDKFEFDSWYKINAE